jgi:hypothetical protein
MLSSISFCRSDACDTTIGLCGKRELSQFVRALQPPPRLQLSITTEALLPIPVALSSKTFGRRKPVHEVSLYCALNIAIVLVESSKHNFSYTIDYPSNTGTRRKHQLLVCQRTRSGNDKNGHTYGRVQNDLVTDIQRSVSMPCRNPKEAMNCRSMVGGGDKAFSYRYPFSCRCRSSLKCRYGRGSCSAKTFMTAQFHLPCCPIRRRADERPVSEMVLPEVFESIVEVAEWEKMAPFEAVFTGCVIPCVDEQSCMSDGLNCPADQGGIPESSV